VANAGPNQNVVLSTLVTLNGAASSDANYDPLTYKWALVSKPTNSTAALTPATLASATPTFTPDIAGVYVATLIVNDGKVDSTPSAVTVTAAAANVAPVANAGTTQTVSRTNGSVVVTLNGTGSTDANGDVLTYRWVLTTQPVGSAAALVTTAPAAPSQPTFTASVAGIYVATLIVNDGKLDSAPATVVISVQ
jgi:chitinase